MRVAHTGAATPAASLEEDVQIAARVGTDGLEIWIPKLRASLERGGTAVVQAALRRHGVTAVSLAPIDDVLFRDQAGAEETAADVHRLAQLGRSLGATWLVLTPGTRPDGADDRDVLTEGRGRLLQLLELARRYDVGLTLTPSGRPTAAVRTLAAAAAILDAVARPRLALALDTFELHAAGSVAADLKACAPRWLGLLRLADAPAEVEPEALREGHRLPPGAGVVPIGAWVSLVRQLGADPPAVVPVPAAPEADPAAWAQQMREAALGSARDQRGRGRAR